MAVFFEVLFQLTQGHLFSLLMILAFFMSTFIFHVFFEFLCKPFHHVFIFYWFSIFIFRIFEFKIAKNISQNSSNLWCLEFSGFLTLFILAFIDALQASFIITIEMFALITLHDWSKWQIAANWASKILFDIKFLITWVNDLIKNKSIVFLACPLQSLQLLFFGKLLGFSGDPLETNLVVNSFWVNYFHHC